MNKIERYPKQIIDINDINRFFNFSPPYPGKDATFLEIGPVWEKVFSRWTTTSLKDVFTSLEQKDLISLKEIYENYYIDGISEGASSGKAFESREIGGNGEEYKDKKALRNFNRILQLGEYLEFSSKDINNIVDNIKKTYTIPSSPNIGQTWGWWINNTFIHFELADYVYFLDTILTILKDLKLNKTLFLGDGSGLLSTLVYENYAIDKSFHIDLSHFLLKQFLNSPNNNNIKYYYAEGFNFKTIIDAEILINQDSFPEMSDESVKKYVECIKYNKIPYILSYNKNVTFEGGCTHSDWESEVRRQGYNLINTLTPTMRNGYHIKLFKLKKNNE